MDRKDYLTKITEEDKYLIKLFQEEVDRINLLYLKAIHSNDITKANQLLKQIRKINNHLANEYWKRAEVRIPQEYAKGGSYIDEVLWMDTNTSLEEILFWKTKVSAYLDELWPVHIEAVNALVDNSKNYVKASLDWMERQALTMINELQQTQVREQLAKGIISWEAKSNDRLIDYFTSQWISWFKDRGWKYWSMDRYVDMLCRTETAIANTQGTINRAIEVWITKFWIVEHSDCCEVCAEMNGDIVDITEWTVELPPFHPNCRWYIVAIVDEEEWRNRLIEPEQVEQIQETKQPKEEKEFKLTDEMKEDYWIQDSMKIVKRKMRQGYEFPMWFDKAVIASSYTSHLYGWRNQRLRQGKLDWMYSEMTDALTDTVENYSEISKNTLYRWTSLTRELFEEMRDSWIYTDKAFMSFSSNPDIAEWFMWSSDTIKTRVFFELENWKWLDLEKITTHIWEKETLMNRDTQFQVLWMKQEYDRLWRTYYRIKIQQL